MESLEMRAVLSGVELDAEGILRVEGDRGDNVSNEKERRPLHGRRSW
jgi:hypothetical protein